MTSQATSTSIGNPNMSRLFTATSTDQAYTNQTETISSSSLGLSMAGVTITFVQSNYAAGIGTWRIVDQSTNQIKRMGFMSLTGYNIPAECQIMPYTVQAGDLFECYVDIADATSNQSTVLAIVNFGGAQEVFTATNVVDATSTALSSLLGGLSLGDVAFGKVVSRIAVSEEDGGSLSNVSLTDAAGGVAATFFGTRRLPTAGGVSNITNGIFNCMIPVAKGWVLKAKVTSA